MIDYRHILRISKLQRELLTEMDNLILFSDRWDFDSEDQQEAVLIAHEHIRMATVALDKFKQWSNQ